MRNNSKGFTLIELLAVIVILAIIALITTPVILNVIEEARKNSAVDKAWGTIDAVRLAYTQAQTNVDPVGIPYTVHFPKDNNKGTENTDWGTDSATGGGYGTGYVNNQPVQASGEMPQAGWVTIRADGSIVAHQLQFGKYYCSTMKDKSSFDANSMVCSRTQADVTVDGANNDKIGKN